MDAWAKGPKGLIATRKAQTSTKKNTSYENAMKEKCARDAHSNLKTGVGLSVRRAPREYERLTPLIADLRIETDPIRTMVAECTKYMSPYGVLPPGKPVNLA